MGCTLDSERKPFSKLSKLLFIVYEDEEGPWPYYLFVRGGTEAGEISQVEKELREIKRVRSEKESMKKIFCR
jgi:hypothetical protein